ncbi:MAG: nitrate reductase molybdenum cofactor assembly chaperone [Candidatus Hydrogenedentes bacterium]|nr:nitrate reductase molybdenum cofactor assembly chaperone [Candidatus Hydrogenedentota bacterium]
MNAVATQTTALAAIGALLEYPDDRFQDRFDEAVDAARALNDDAAIALAEFGREVSGLSTEHAQELYTRSFDLSPVCVPYVSVHLFGAESFKRAELMTGLNAAYERAGFDRGTELPDHVALVLACAPRFDADEWADLVALVLAPALEKMSTALDTAGSPWRHVVRAARALLTRGDESDGY